MYSLDEENIEDAHDNMDILSMAGQENFSFSI